MILKSFHSHHINQVDIFAFITFYLMPMSPFSVHSMILARILKTILHYSFDFRSNSMQPAMKEWNNKMLVTFCLDQLRRIFSRGEFICVARTIHHHHHHWFQWKKDIPKIKVNIENSIMNFRSHLATINNGWKSFQCSEPVPISLKTKAPSYPVTMREKNPLQCPTNSIRINLLR